MEFTQDHVTALILSLSERSPFFSVLCMHANHQITDEVQTAATDGRTIYYNAGFMGELAYEERLGVLIHEVMHNALQHTSSKYSSPHLNANLFNQACDYVINILIVDEGFKLPAGCLLNYDYRDMTAEEVYLKLLREPQAQQQQQQQDQIHSDILPPPPGGNSDLSEHWKQATKSAVERVSEKSAGSMSASLQRLLGMDKKPPQVNWQQELANFVSHSCDDYGSYDRRFIYQNAYFDSLYNEQLTNLVVAVDTSGSINMDALQSFLAELRQIIYAFPQLEAELFWFDANISGPHPLTSETIETPTGGGGTSLYPLWKHLEERHEGLPEIMIIFTDGYFERRRLYELCPTLWVITPDGKDQEFDFGTKIQLT